jgi:virginiamycin B lyase
MRERSMVFILVAVSFTLLAGAPIAQRGGPPVQLVQLPAGAARDLVQTTCTRCHALTLIVNSWGNTREGWERLFSSMVALPSDQGSAIAEYLAANFPVKPAPEAVLLGGPASVSFREWMARSLGSRPHDPLEAPDGSLWWTGQYANVLGRVDPKSGAIREFPLKKPDSQPHGLVADAAGTIWFTAVAGHYIGKLDPSTGAVTEYPLPDPKARGPHTPIFDQKGTLWFTLQSGMVGRLTRETGEIKLAATPTANTYPYGIQVNSKGVPWYVDFRGNRIGSIDPVSMTIREYPLPDPAARPRRIAITPDDAVWYTDYARGYLGRFDPATGQVREWLSPGGKQSLPYGIAAIGDIIWYSESGVRPNTLVRFDPRSQAFQTWVIPSGGGVVRNMMATRSGNLVLACSGVNRVALVEVSDKRLSP